MSKFLFLSIRCIFAIIVTFAFILVLFFADTNFVAKQSFPINNLTSLMMILIAILVFLLFRRLLYKKGVHLPSYHKSERYVLPIAMLLFLLEIYISTNIFCTNEWDPGGIWTTAVARYNMDIGWCCGINHYFSMYPNNLLLLIMEEICLKLNRMFGFWGNDYLMMSAIVVDCFSMSLSCLYIYKVLDLYVDKVYAFFGFFVSVVLIGLSPWCSICYSDSLGIMFPIMVYYYFMKPYDNVLWDRLGKIFSAALTGLGFCMKPQCAIVFIAIVIIYLISLIKEKNNRGVRLIELCVFIIIALTSVGSVSFFVGKEYESIGLELDSSLEFGMTHFFMMGLNESGGGAYSHSDVEYSMSFDSPQTRRDANISTSIFRLKEMGISGYLTHITKKILSSYHDGTFTWGSGGFIQVTDNLNSHMTPFLKALYYPDGSYYNVFLQTMQFIWIFILLFVWLSGFIKLTDKNKNVVSVIMLTIIGASLFQILFEVRARYFFVNVPLFIVLAIMSFDNVVNSLSRKYNGKGKNYEDRKSIIYSDTLL